MGVGTIMKAKKVLMVVNGKGKAGIVKLTNPPRTGVICWNRETPEDKPVPRTELRIDCGLSEDAAKEIKDLI